MALFINLVPLGPYFYFQSTLFTVIHTYLLLQLCNSDITLKTRQEIHSAVLFLPPLKYGRPGKQGDPYSSGHQSYEASVCLGLV